MLAPNSILTITPPPLRAGVADKKTGTPISIGVNGCWGTGKTTLLKRLRQKLDETAALMDASKAAHLSFANDKENPQDHFRTCLTVWFNRGNMLMSNFYSSRWCAHTSE